MNDTTPLAFHPWEFISEEMQERGWDKTRLALEMSVGETAEAATAVEVQMLVIDIIEHIRDPNVLIGDETDKRLCVAFGVSPGFFKRLHESWRKALPPSEDSSNG